mmetsp:Transcript_9168/g.33616  ORF Transcript_9168/g.33616 Transcript_9168/m.33616 type:complete len:85 (+) Transcript_9168:183-437(+)
MVSVTMIVCPMTVSMCFLARGTALVMAVIVRMGMPMALCVLLLALLTALNMLVVTMRVRMILCLLKQVRFDSLDDSVKIVAADA